MKVARAAFASATVGLAGAVSLRSIFHGGGDAPDDASPPAASAADVRGERALASCGTETAWHPIGGTDWAQGFCLLTVDTNSPCFDTELDCCNNYFGGQTSGACLASLPDPPTTSPTGSGGLDVYYPDYDTAWSEAYCINERPLPSGRPTYDTMLDCCKGAYAGQTSGVCLAALPSPPTTSPTGSGGLDVFYPDYDTAWSEASCLNEGPLPSGRPTYDTMLDCCKGAYAGQLSGACLAALPSPPTTSPTGSGGLDVFYPDYDTPWAEATCINEGPLPSGRPTYDTMLECCKGDYGGQMSGACLAALPSPPTTSPSLGGGLLDFYYPDYDTAWSEATCKNEAPLPFNPGDRPTYDTMFDCCKLAYGGQMSGACLAALPSPPTTSPTGSGGLDVYYPDYSTAWSEASCINERPLPSGRPTYDTMLECCKGAYAGQTSGACLAALPSPPTTSPTGSGGLDVFYPDYATAWSEATCINEGPLPSGRPTYDTMLECCKGSYGSQSSGACLAALPSPPTTSPTGSGGLDVFYPRPGLDWALGTCTNEPPLPPNVFTYDTQEECCTGYYGTQSSLVCQCDIDPCHACSCTGAGSWNDPPGSCPNIVCE